MRSSAMLVLSFLLLAQMAFAIGVKEQNAIININDDGSTDWTISLKYENNTENSDFFVMGYIKNVAVSGASKNILNCTVDYQSAGTLISCKKINETEVTYSFTAHNLVRSIGGSKMFSYGFPITGIVEEFRLLVNLPLGAGLVQKDKIQVPGLTPFAPESGTEGSDGRMIYVKWLFVKPSLGQSIQVSVLYEQIFGPTQLFALVAAAVVAIPLLIIFLILRKGRGIEQVLPVLNDNERKVMKMILESHGDIDQRKIVRECDMSKPKVSRILKDLEERGLVQVIRRGRANKVRLVYDNRKKLKEEKRLESSGNEKEQKGSEKKFYAEQKSFSEDTDETDL